MQNQINASQATVLTISNLGRFNTTAKVYLEPDNRYSQGGGRITISVPDYDLLGTHFFSHVGPDTFAEFIAQCDAHYLINKLFNVDKSIPFEDSDDVFKWVRHEGMEQLKEARQGGMVHKGELRDLYEFLSGREFEGRCHLVDSLPENLFSVVSNIYGDDWFIELELSKPNPKYRNLVSIIEGTLKHVGDLDLKPEHTPSADHVQIPVKPTKEIYQAFYDAFNSSTGGNTAQRFKEGYKAIVQHVLEPSA